MVEFEHGTATGRRIVKIDGNNIVHRDWMFRLVGDEVFMFNNIKFIIRVDPMPGKALLLFYPCDDKCIISLQRLYRSEVFLFVVGEWKKLQAICSIAIKNTRNLVGQSWERRIQSCIR